MIEFSIKMELRNATNKKQKSASWRKTKTDNFTLTLFNIYICTGGFKVTFSRINKRRKCKQFYIAM